MMSSEERQTTVTNEPLHLAAEELEAGLPEICLSPKEIGVLNWIVRRPENGQREVLQEGRLDLTHGLLGDNWKTRGSATTPDGSSNPELQLTVMNSRVIALLARVKERWALAGDQLFVDLDLSAENLPAGARLAIGEAVIEVTAHPHAGCKKFQARFGVEAVKFTNSPEGKLRRLRGLNAKVTHPGTVRAGDTVRKLRASV